MKDDRIEIDIVISPCLASRLLDFVGMTDRLDSESKIGQIRIIVMDEVANSPLEETFEIDEDWLDFDEAVDYAIDEMKGDWSEFIDDEDLNEDDLMDERASIIAYITTLILNEWNHLRDTLQ